MQSIAEIKILIKISLIISAYHADSVRQEIFIQLIRPMKFQSDFAICCNQKRQVEKGGDVHSAEVCLLQMGVSSATRRRTVAPLRRRGGATDVQTPRSAVTIWTFSGVDATPFCVAFTILITGSAIPRLRLCIRVRFAPIFASVRRIRRL